MPAPIRLLIAPALVLAALCAMAAEPEPHTLSTQSECETCHNGAPGPGPVAAGFSTLAVLPAPGAFRGDGIAMCTTCHAGTESHVVGTALDFAVPADLPLGDGATITCLSCHHVHGSLQSDRPRASYSFMDRLTNDPRLHKSFLLRRSNVDGELCLVCHDPSDRGHRP